MPRGEAWLLTDRHHFRPGLRFKRKWKAACLSYNIDIRASMGHWSCCRCRCCCCCWKRRRIMHTVKKNLQGAEKKFQQTNSLPTNGFSIQDVWDKKCDKFIAASGRTTRRGRRGLFRWLEDNFRGYKEKPPTLAQRYWWSRNCTAQWHYKAPHFHLGRPGAYHRTDVEWGDTCPTLPWAKNYRSIKKRGYAIVLFFKSRSYVTRLTR